MTPYNLITAHLINPGRMHVKMADCLHCTWLYANYLCREKVLHSQVIARNIKQADAITCRLTIKETLLQLINS